MLKGLVYVYQGQTCWSWPGRTSYRSVDLPTASDSSTHWRDGGCNDRCSLPYDIDTLLMCSLCERCSQGGTPEADHLRLPGVSADTGASETWKRRCCSQHFFWLVRCLGFVYVIAKCIEDNSDKRSDSWAAWTVGTCLPAGTQVARTECAEQIYVYHIPSVISDGLNPTPRDAQWLRHFLLCPFLDLNFSVVFCWSCLSSFVFLV